MKKTIFLSLLILAGLTAFSKAFLIYPKGDGRPEVMLYSVIDSIYFDFSPEGDLRKNFVTNEGVKSFNLNDIKHVGFRDESYMKSHYKRYVIPMEECRLRIRYTYMIDAPGIFTTVDGKPYRETYTTAISVLVDEGSVAPGATLRLPLVMELDNETNHPLIDSINTRLTDTILIKRSDRPTLMRKFEYDPILTPFEDTLRLSMNPEIFPKPVLQIDADWAHFKWENDSTLALVVEKNEGKERNLNISINPWDDSIFIYDIKGMALRVFQQRIGYHTRAEHISALRDFYDSCNGPQWLFQKNWWSDKPIWEWDKINDIGHQIDRVHTLICGDEKVTGNLPESFVILMDDAEHISLQDCGITGFPHCISHHERWNEYGWDFIHQRLWYGGGEIDYSDINLKLNDYNLMNYKDGELSTVYKELAKNKLTWVCHGAISQNSYSDPIDKVIINKLLDYQPKGFGLVIVRDPFSYYGEQFDDPEYRDLITKFEQESGLDDIIWTNGFGDKVFGVNTAGIALGSMMLFDSEGNLLWNADRDWGIDLQWYVDKIDAIVRKHLGDPVAHDPYIPKLYTSTDFSRDGEVETLQKATTGKGIDVVFIGDGFTDRDLTEENGYEQIMREGMEHLFSEEPLKSLRDRFNVYSVIAVSPNGFVTDGEQAINRDPNKVAEYLKPLGIDMEKTHVCVIENKPNQYLNNGFTSMYDAGGSLAIIEQGMASDIIVHEVAGHGMGKLVDEYIVAGYENNHVQEGHEQEFKDWIESEYHSRGWGMNVSATDNPEEVPWSHMLKDGTYSSEVGIYQGAWMWPYDLWRPSESSMMNNDYSHFNAPSREAIYKYVMSESEGDTWTYDFEEFKTFDQTTQAASQQTKSTMSVHSTPEQISEQRTRKIVKGKVHGETTNPVYRIIKVADRYEIQSSTSFFSR